ncbi:hypothetical protein ACFL6I_28635 [candidate division KSB1 bacterium]
MNSSNNMFCEHCGIETKEKAQFCQNCGKSTSIKSEPVITNNNVASPNLKSEVIMKCGNCDYIGTPEKARNPFSIFLAWVCVVFAPLITVIYFVFTHKYRCSVCKSTFLGIKNKDGVFVAQRGSNALNIFIIVIIGIAIVGILSSVVLASLNSAREKARQATQESVFELNK